LVYKSKIDVDFVKIEIDIELVNQLIFGFKKKLNNDSHYTHFVTAVGRFILCCRKSRLMGIGVCCCCCCRRLDGDDSLMM